ncbi:hypothetical protein [Flavihumibacter sp. CACIAM 22H1]|uniref:hypothetical protein n=1 Tax=Flavihumibacter sp. CACIAM 22H1 TaxID=1812911 RepID=UPI0007A91CC6|nr:hypothetical protein [Flavihumibacter sp. CACIAM 22H1]KYP13622.1 MAG: hypothetical protein A1D16_08495 [Flavihumibacter sp. CACIAM 22H1]
MKRKLLAVLVFLFYLMAPIFASPGKNIKDFNVFPKNDGKTNSRNLQKAIDWASKYGAALWVEPSDEPYALASGLILKKNVSLIGVHGPVPRATAHPTKKAPVGSVFKIEDNEHPLFIVESATQIKGIQFWYAHQELKDPSKIIRYPPTIQVSKTSRTEGVTLSNLVFYGEYIAMDFNASEAFPCELILIEQCYGYPLSGEFIRINYCYDIPRFLHCHVNPSIMRQMQVGFSKAVVDAVIARKTFAYTINNTDNAQLIDLFTFATWGGIYLGDESYGQLTNFNLDCVTVGLHKAGNNTKNRNWQIAQGSIIANAGTEVENIHPLIIEGQGHTAITNVEAFSGDNPALTNTGVSFDFMQVRGNEKLTISLFGCRMRNYVSKHPFTIKNTAAIIQAVACIDKDEQLYNIIINR